MVRKIRWIIFFFLATLKFNYLCLWLLGIFIEKKEGSSSSFAESSFSAIL